jgi:hypothetical protein
MTVQEHLTQAEKKKKKETKQTEDPVFLDRLDKRTNSKN